MQMRSMWDRILEAPIPINRMSAMVISAEPWWLRSFRNEAIPERRLKGMRETNCDERLFLQVEDVALVTKAPPVGYKDYRGVKSDAFLVIGYAHKRERVSSRTIACNEKILHLNKSKGGAGILVNNRLLKWKIDNIHSWYVMFPDGQISSRRQQTINRALRTGGDLSPPKEAKARDVNDWHDGPYPADETIDVLAMRLKGMEFAEIGAKFNRTAKQVRGWLHRTLDSLSLSMETEGADRISPNNPSLREALKQMQLKITPETAQQG